MEDDKQDDQARLLSRHALVLALDESQSCGAAQWSCRHAGIKFDEDRCKIDEFILSGTKKDVHVAHHVADHLL